MEKKIKVNKRKVEKRRGKENENERSEREGNSKMKDGTHVEKEKGTQGKESERGKEKVGKTMGSMH